MYGGVAIHRMLKPTIIAISMATVMAGAAISPALGVIAKNFPDANPTLIKLILTIPSLMIIPFSFVSSYLTTKITKRSIVLIGLIIYMIGGVGPQFVSTIEAIIALRLLLGIGVGLLMPLADSLINDHFEGKERTKMMGYNSAFSNFGGILTMLFAGWLATLSWEAPFNVYLLGLVIFILVFLYLPKGQIQKPSKSEGKIKMPKAVYIYGFAMGGIMLAYYSVSTNMALFLEQNNLGGSAIAGTVVAFSTVGGMITSLLLFQIDLTLKKYLIPVMLLIMGVAFLTITLTNSIALVMISVTLIGLGQGSLFPFLTLKILDVVKVHQADKAMAIASSLIFLGQFISPVILDSIGSLVGMPTIRFQYGLLGSIILIFVFINFFTISKNKSQNKA